MKEAINKKTLERLAELARIELDGRSEEKILEDLSKILEYFEELKEVDVGGVELTAGGTAGVNVFRDDGTENCRKLDGEAGKLVKSFPEEEGGFLKVPPVFE